jgi:hypothetical protein
MAAISELVLVHIDNKPGFYARIEDITPDVKPGWWQVKLLVLSLPLQVFNWILDSSQIEGAPFSMGGTPVMLEKIVSPVSRREEAEGGGVIEAGGGVEDQQRKGAKVVSLADRKKDKK